MRVGVIFVLEVFTLLTPAILSFNASIIKKHVNEKYLYDSAFTHVEGA